MLLNGLLEELRVAVGAQRDAVEEKPGCATAASIFFVTSPRTVDRRIEPAASRATIRCLSRRSIFVGAVRVG